MRLIDLGVATPANAVGTVVLCHGFPGKNLNVPLARALSSHGYRVVAFRYTGVEEANATWSFAAAARDTALVLRTAGSEGPTPIIALGYSMGALHLMRALHSARDVLADALVLLGPALSLPSFRAHLASRGDTAERFISDGGGLLTGTAEARIAEYRALEREEQPLSFARTIALPTLLVHGTSDDVVPVADVWAAVGTMPHACALIVNDDHDYARTADQIGRVFASIFERSAALFTALSP